jgi:hypothetical protein
MIKVAIAARIVGGAGNVPRMSGEPLPKAPGANIINQTGFFSSVGLSWNNDYQFGGKGEELPTVLDVTCAFTPIHKFNTAYGGQYINNVGNTLESPQPIGAAEKIVKSDKA